MNNRISNQTKILMDKSEKGDLVSSIQLTTMYKEGIGVDIDKEMSNYFKSLSIKQMSSKNFYISNIILSNFKGFNKIKIPLNSSMNIFIGNNGSGKSTVLDAIRKCLTHLMARLITRSTNGEFIEQNEIRNTENTSTIELNYCVDKAEFSMLLAKSRSLSDEKIKGDYSGINQLGLLLREANQSDPLFSLPLLASYTVERSMDVSTKDISESDELINPQIWDKATSYSKSLSGKADFKIFFRWFKELSDNIKSKDFDASKLNLVIKEKEELLKNPIFNDLLNDGSQSEHIRKFISEVESEILGLKSKLNASTDRNIKILNCVKDAIHTFLPEFSDLRIERDPLDLLIKKNNTELSVLQLSQGEKSILALVADIARRLVLLNPNSDAPLNGNGVVLIDEIDLHLHPEWQQKIIQRLNETFKNIQFIITTHSPQVCHTVDGNSIYIIRDSKLYKVPKGVRGAVSSWVLKNLFFVEERPPTDKYTLMLKEYTELVYSDKFDDIYTQDLSKKLSDHFGVDYEDLVKLNLYIENRRWELDDEAN